MLHQNPSIFLGKFMIAAMVRDQANCVPWRENILVHRLIPGTNGIAGAVYSYDISGRGGIIQDDRMGWCMFKFFITTKYLVFTYFTQAPASFRHAHPMPTNALCRRESHDATTPSLINDEPIGSRKSLVIHGPVVDTGEVRLGEER